MNATKFYKASSALLGLFAFAASASAQLTNFTYSQHLENRYLSDVETRDRSDQTTAVPLTTFFGGGVQGSEEEFSIGGISATGTAVANVTTGSAFAETNCSFNIVGDGYYAFDFMGAGVIDFGGTTFTYTAANRDSGYTGFLPAGALVTIQGSAYSSTPDVRVYSHYDFGYGQPPAVPEPSTLSLGFGVTAMALRRRFRKSFR